MNLAKSFVKFSKSTSHDHATTYKSILTVPQVNKVPNHLPIDITKGKTRDFTYLMDSITKRILSWAPLRLSQAAKLVLNNSILVSISSHVMKCFKLPLSITNKIDSLISRFWWATNGDRGIHWARRHTIQCPKGMGGLGIRAVATFNQHYFSDKLLGCIVILNYY